MDGTRIADLGANGCCMWVISWVSLAMLNSSLVLNMPEPHALPPHFDTHGSTQLVLEADAVETAEQLDAALESKAPVEIGQASVLREVLAPLARGVVLYEERSSKTSQFTLQLLRGPVWSSMTASVSF